MISFKCPQCAHGYRVDAQFAGKKVRCKQCQAVITVPKPAAGGAAKTAADSVAAFNLLLQELSQYERQAPALDIEAK